MIKVQDSVEIGGKCNSEVEGWTPEAVQHLLLRGRGKSWSNDTSEEYIQGNRINEKETWVSTPNYW